MNTYLKQFTSSFTRLTQLMLVTLNFAIKEFRSARNLCIGIISTMICKIYTNSTLIFLFNVAFLSTLGFEFLLEKRYKNSRFTEFIRNCVKYLMLTACALLFVNLLAVIQTIIVSQDSILNSVDAYINTGGTSTKMFRSFCLLSLPLTAIIGGFKKYIAYKKARDIYQFPNFNYLSGKFQEEEALKQNNYGMLICAAMVVFNIIVSSNYNALFVFVIDAITVPVGYYGLKKDSLAIQTALSVLSMLLLAFKTFFSMIKIDLKELMKEVLRKMHTVNENH